MNADLAIVLGLDDKDFRRQLRQSGGYAKRQAWQIAKDFERAEAQRERQTRAHMQRVEKMYRTGAVAVVAGVAAITAALRAAAETDAQTAHTVNALRDAYRGLLADVGRDLGGGGLVGYLTAAVQKAGELRNIAVDAYAVVFSGGDLKGIREQRAIEDAQKARDAEAKRAMAAAEIAGQAFGMDPEQARRRALNKSINEAGLDPGRAAALRERLEAEMRAEREQKAAEEQTAAENAERADRARRLRQDADAGTARAGRSDNPAERAAAAGMDFRASAAEIEARVMADETIPAAQKQTEIMREHEVLRQRYITDLDTIERAEAAAAQRAEAEAAASERQLEIDLARAEGRDKEADRLETIARYEREVQRIREMADISEERRDAMLDRAARIRDATMDKAARGGGSERAIAAGLAGGDTLLRQIGGAGAPAATTAKNTGEMVRVLRAIERKVGATVAVAG